MLKLGDLQKKERQTEGITIDSFDVSKKEWIKLEEVQFEVAKQHFVDGVFRRAFKASNDNILFKISVGYRKSIINLQRKLLMSWVLMLNVKRESPFKCIAFQGILYLSLSNSALAISTQF